MDFSDRLSALLAAKNSAILSSKLEQAAVAVTVYPERISHIAILESGRSMAVQIAVYSSTFGSISIAPFTKLEPL